MNYEEAKIAIKNLHRPILLDILVLGYDNRLLRAYAHDNSRWIYWDKMGFARVLPSTHPIEEKRFDNIDYWVGCSRWERYEKLDLIF